MNYLYTDRQGEKKVLNQAGQLFTLARYLAKTLYYKLLATFYGFANTTTIYTGPLSMLHTSGSTMAYYFHTHSF